MINTLDFTKRNWLGPWRYLRVDEDYGIWQRQFATDMGLVAVRVYYPNSGVRLDMAYTKDGMLPVASWNHVRTKGG